MDLRDSYTYEAPIDAVLAILRDPDATVAKYESMGNRAVEILECTERAALLRIVSSRVVDVDLPGFAKRVLRPTNTMRQTDEWKRQRDGSWSGTFDVQIQGAPLHVYGSMRLTPQGAASVHAVDLHVDCKVPIIGGRIAEWAAKGDVRRSLDGEFAFNSSRLAAGHGTRRRAPRSA